MYSTIIRDKNIVRVKGNFFTLMMNIKKGIILLWNDKK